MKKIIAAFSVSVLMFLVAACSSNIQYSRTDEAVGAKRVAMAKAKVVEIDYEKRTAVLQDANGQMQFITISPEAKNLEQVKVGDMVVAEVIESIEIALRESSEDPSADTFESVQRDTNMPGAQKVTVVESTARVEKIDYETRIITLSGTNGRTVTTQVGPEVKRFNEIKPGDIISMQIVKQTIIRVESSQ